jgi:hypothetical protein
VTKQPQTVAELYAAHESFGEQAKAFYDKRDIVLKKLVQAWKKNKSARIDPEHILEIEDSFRGQIKAFAPSFAHRYKLKLKAVSESEKP